MLPASIAPSALPGADHRVQLVDEQDHAAFLLREIVQHALEALLELTAELGACDQRAHVEREDPLVAKALGHLAVHDALCESFDDRGLADAGLADQHGVVLGATLQHLDRAADLVVPADDRVELALLGALGQVNREFLERLAALLSVGVVDLLTAAHVLDGFFDGTLHDTGVLEQLAERTLVLERGEHEQLARDVLVAALLSELVGQVQELVRSFEMWTSPPAPSTFGRRSSACPSCERSRFTFAPALSSNGRIDPPSCPSNASIR
jgi:hypothetical protein